MEIILLKNFKKLGYVGQKIQVNPGYARNYLIPNQIALLSTVQNLKKFNYLTKKNHKYQKLEIIKSQLQVYKIKKLGLITIITKSENKDKIFGSISEKDIAEKIISLGVKIKKNDIFIQEHIIRKLGMYKVIFQPHKDVSCYILVNILSK